MRFESFYSLSARREERAAVQPLITSFDDAPIHLTTQRTVMRVITFVEDLIPTELDVTDVWRELARRVANRIRINAAD
jgi:hypothetical protein